MHGCFLLAPPVVFSLSLSLSVYALVCVHCVCFFLHFDKRTNHHACVCVLGGTCSSLSRSPFLVLCADADANANAGDAVLGSSDACQREILDLHLVPEHQVLVEESTTDNLASLCDVEQQQEEHEGDEDSVLEGASVVRPWCLHQASGIQALVRKLESTEQCSAEGNGRVERWSASHSGPEVCVCV